MKGIDLPYICRTIGSLAGMPIRVFQNGEEIFYYSVVRLPKDPMSVYRDQIMQITDHIGYFATSDFHYYGIINSGDIKIVLGPSGQIPNTEQELRELAFLADVPADQTEEFISGMKSIVHMPIESILQILCTVNYILNDEKKNLEDIEITDSSQYENNLATREDLNNRMSEIGKGPDPSLHNTYDLEETLMYMVRKGDITALKEWVSQAPAVRGGLLAPNQIRQCKNIFIVSTTLASRAAIRGGMDVDDAFTLSDAYIQRCELLSSPEQISGLQYHMIMDFTERVSRLRQTKETTPLILDVSNYINHHISEVISTEAIAKDLHMSRTYLCRKFKKESGMTLNECILKEKTEEAKRLLRYTDKSLTAIALYLGFSSQSHFSKVFREFAGISPGDYRQKRHWGQVQSS